jgi:hypothetical protein
MELLPPELLPPELLLPELEPCAELETRTPFDQTNFDPDLMHWKVSPPATDFCPNFEHLPPAFGAAL